MLDAGRDLLGRKGDVVAGEHALGQQAAMSLDCVENYHRGLAALRLGGVYGILDGVDVMAVDLYRIPAAAY